LAERRADGGDTRCFPADVPFRVAEVFQNQERLDRVVFEGDQLCDKRALQVPIDFGLAAERFRVVLGFRRLDEDPPTVVEVDCEAIVAAWHFIRRLPRR
jgi:hypothetical protein